MNPIPIFVVQFVWFLLVWGTIALLVVKPKLDDSTPNWMLSSWIAPQLFRVLGLGLLVPNLSPHMPGSFAIPTAVGDATTAVLAWVSLVALHRRWARARLVVWVCNVFGSADLVVVLVHAARIEAAQFLAAQWFVPAVLAPLMVVSHIMVFRALLAHGSPWSGSPPNGNVKHHRKEGK